MLAIGRLAPVAGVLLARALDKVLPRMTNPQLPPEGSPDPTPNGTPEDESTAPQSCVIEEEQRAESMFVSGWRPAAGWVCVFALACQYFLIPLTGWVAVNWLGWNAPPTLNLDDLMTLLFGMLGLGAFRTYERVSLAKAAIKTDGGFLKPKRKRSR